MFSRHESGTVTAGRAHDKVPENRQRDQGGKPGLLVGAYRPVDVAQKRFPGAGMGQPRELLATEPIITRPAPRARGESSIFSEAPADTSDSFEHLRCGSPNFERVR